MMMMVPMRRPLAFLDSVGRGWEWKFIPKDMPMSEWSAHNAVMLVPCLALRNVWPLSLPYASKAER